MRNRPADNGGAIHNENDPRSLAERTGGQRTPHILTEYPFSKITRSYIRDESIERIESALSHVYPTDRDTWLRMGMAIKCEIEDQGFEIWDQWSRGAASYKEADAKSVWKSIRTDGAVTIGTLYHEAKLGGWRDDETYTKPTLEQIAERKRQAEVRAKKEAEERAKDREKAAGFAKTLAKAPQARADHPYLSRKNVNPHVTIRELPINEIVAILGYTPKSKGEALQGRILIVPVVLPNGGIATCELVDESGLKSAIAGGQKSGAYWLSERLDNPKALLIGEGVATVLSAREDTGYPVVAALSGGNLKAVSETFRQRFPDTKIVVLADMGNDGTPYQPAVEVAQAVGGYLATPTTSGTDFNDMHIEHGALSVRQAIEAALNQKPEQPSDAQSWSAPRPLPSIDDAFPVPKFDPELLPVALRPWVLDISERMQCPVEFVAVSAVVALSSVIGRKVCVRPKRFDDWKVFPNLWGVCIGRPGVMKSPAQSAAMAPLRRLEAEANEHFQDEARGYEVSKKLNAMDIENRESAAKKLVKERKFDEAERLLKSSACDDPAPTRKRFVVTDATVEALSEILIENPWGILAYRDEIAGLLISLDREGQESSRSFYLQAYDGDKPWVSDRIVRGRDKFIPAVCLSMLGSIQPGKLASYVRSAIYGDDGDDGLLQRFGLMVFPIIDGSWRNVDRPPSKDAAGRAFDVFQRLSSFDPGDEPKEVKFSEDAQDLFEEWRETFEERLRTGEMLSAVESHLAKYRKLVPALALVLSVADGEEEISADSLGRALDWSETLEAHALKVYGIGASDIEGARVLLQKIKSGKVEKGFSLRDVHRKCWSFLTDREQIRTAIDCLIEHGYLKAIDEVTAGRTKTTYQINPEFSHE